MKITKSKLKLNVPGSKYLPSIQEEIRQNLERMGVSGLSIDIRYDVRGNVSLVRFNFNGKNYEMKVSNQKDIRSNMYAIARRIEYKARMHLLDIEPFEISISPYIQIGYEGEYKQDFEVPKASVKAYITLGIPEYSSNFEIEQHYKKLVKAFHPDMALSDEKKIEFGKRLAEINEAYNEIKKERGL